MCVVSMTPIAPLVAPMALIYFLFCTPLWRRNCIYVYRPDFDSGGIRWPFLSDIFVSCIVASQILLTVTMALRNAAGPAMFSFFALIPVYFYRKKVIRKYYRAYMDAGLVQLATLDGWDNTTSTSREMREEYRKFLVDSHRAAYVGIN